MSRTLATIPKIEGEVRVCIEAKPGSDIEYVDMRIWMTDARRKKEYRTKCGFALGPKRLGELRAAIDEAIEYFAEKKRKAEEERAKEMFGDGDDDD